MPRASRPLAVLRPEPGNARSVARIVAAGMTAIALPLFAVRPVAWDPPSPRDFDALLLTSANAVRHAGAGLAELVALPVVAVGAATAAAARAAELSVAITGTADAAAAIAQAQAAGLHRLLHLAGRDRIDTGLPAITVYASETLDVPDPDLTPLQGSVALLHSVRAAARFAALVDRARIDRAAIRIAALSPAILSAAGDGWDAAEAAQAPTETALLATAAHLAD